MINTLPEKPLIIGHSMAGMATMKLVEMGRAAAGVSIDGAPPKNVFPPFQTLKTVLPAFGFFSLKKYYMGSRKWYDYAFFNTIPGSEKEKAFEKFAVPESYKVSRQLVLNSFSNIDFKKNLMYHFCLLEVRVIIFFHPVLHKQLPEGIMIQIARLT